MEEQSILQKKPFGLNIAVPHKTVAEYKKVAKQEIENISVNPFLNYLDENDKVFSGEVASEIRKYQAQIYALGQTMREGQPRSTFSVKV